MQRSTHTALRGVLATLGTVTFAVALSAGAATASTAQHPTIKTQMPAKVADPCPSGNVCIYPDDTGNGAPDTYYRYGSYNLRNKFGMHLIVNNQTGGAGFRLCTSYGGQGCGDRKGPGTYHENLSPINSILVEP